MGEIIGGLCFGILGHLLVRHGRDPVVLTGFVSTLAAFFLAFINLPGKAPLHETTDDAFITSNAYIALLTSFLLGKTYNIKLLVILFIDNISRVDIIMSDYIGLQALEILASTHKYIQYLALRIKNNHPLHLQFSNLFNLPQPRLHFSTRMSFRCHISY